MEVTQKLFFFFLHFCPASIVPRTAAGPVIMLFFHSQTWIISGSVCYRGDGGISSFARKDPTRGKNKENHSKILTLQDKEVDFLSLRSEGEEDFWFIRHSALYALNKWLGCTQRAPVSTKGAGRFPPEQRIKRRKRCRVVSPRCSLFVLPRQVGGEKERFHLPRHAALIYFHHPLTVDCLACCHYRWICRCLHSRPVVRKRDGLRKAAWLVDRFFFFLHNRFGRACRYRLCIFRRLPLCFIALWNLP